MRAAVGRAWAWLTLLETPLVTRKRADQWAKDAFRLGVDAGAFGQVAPSQPVRARFLDGMPRGVVGVEIPPAVDRTVRP